MNTELTTEELIALALNELDASRAAAVTECIARDAVLAVRFEQVRVMLGSLAQGVLLTPPAATMQRAIAIGRPAAAPGRLSWLADAGAAVAQVIRDSLVATPALGFRGQSDGRHLSCSCGEARIDLLVDEDFDEDLECAGVIVHGQVAGVRAREVAACRVGTTEPLASIAAHDNGTFSLRIGAEESDLVIQTDTGAIRVSGIKC